MLHARVHPHVARRPPQILPRRARRWLRGGGGAGASPETGPPPLLPTTREEMRARGWDELDVLIVTGDAYVDHPAFGPVLIARFLEGRGFRVGIVAQPRWTATDDIAAHGAPAALRRA